MEDKAIRNNLVFMPVNTERNDPCLNILAWNLQNGLYEFYCLIEWILRLGQLLGVQWFWLYHIQLAF